MKYAMIIRKENSIEVKYNDTIKYDIPEHCNAWIRWFKMSGLEIAHEQHKDGVATIWFC